MIEVLLGSLLRFRGDLRRGPYDVQGRVVCLILGVEGLEIFQERLANFLLLGQDAGEVALNPLDLLLCFKAYRVFARSSTSGCDGVREKREGCWILRGLVIFAALGGAVLR